MISLEFGSFREFIELYGGRISEQGMFIESDDPAEVGSTVEFEVSLSDNFRLLHGTGEVVWAVGADGILDLPPGMAVRFKDTDEPSRRLIARLVDNHRGAGGRVFSLDQPGGLAPSEAPSPPPQGAPDLLESAQDLWRHRAPAVSGPLDGPLGGQAESPSAEDVLAAPIEAMEGREAVLPAGEPDGPAREAEEPPRSRPLESEEIFTEPPPLGIPGLDEEPGIESPTGPWGEESAAEREAPAESAAPDLERSAELGALLEGDPLPAPGAADGEDPSDRSMEFWMGSEPVAEPVAESRPEAAPEPPALEAPTVESPAAEAFVPRTPEPVAPPPRTVPQQPAAPFSVAPDTAASTPPSPGPAGVLSPPAPAPPVPAIPPGPPVVAAPPVELPDETEVGTAVAPPLAGAGQVRPSGRPRWVLLAATLVLVALLGVAYQQRDRLLGLMGAGGSEPVAAPAASPKPAAPDPVPAAPPAAAPDSADGGTAPPATAAPGEAPEGAAPAKEESAPSSAGSAPSSESPPAAVAAPDAERPPPALPEPAEGEAPALASATRLETVRWETVAGETVLTLEFDGAVRSGEYEIMRVESPPPRELIRLFGLRRFGQTRFEVGTPEVVTVRTGFHDLPTGAELHVVIDLASDEMAVTGVQTGFRGLRIKISRAQ